MAYNEMAQLTPEELNPNFFKVKESPEKPNITEYVINSADRCISSALKDMTQDDRNKIFEKAKLIEM